LVRIKIGFTAFALAMLAAGCASTDVPMQSQKQFATSDDDPNIVFTGSRIPRKASQNTQGVTQTTKEDWQRYNQPGVPQQGN
jgi:hypothetical protein